jgi:hypothetical protein
MTNGFGGMSSSEAPSTPSIPSAATATANKSASKSAPAAATGAVAAGTQSRIERIMAGHGVTPAATTKAIFAGKEISDKVALDNIWNALKNAKVAKGKPAADARELQLCAGDKRATIMVAANGTAYFKVAARPGQTATQNIYKLEGLNIATLGDNAVSATTVATRTPATAPATPVMHAAPAAPAMSPAAAPAEASAPSTSAPVAAIRTETNTH